MSNSHNLCVLVAEIVGGDRVVTRLGEAETSRAVERCLNRVDLAIGGSGGEIVARDNAAVIATFAQSDSGVMAACEAIDRVRKLPPVSGTQMRLRIGVHYGPVDGKEGEGVEGARQILLACTADQSLASAVAVAELSSSVRHFASTEAFHDDAQGALPWPVFAIGNQIASVAATMRPRPQPASPLTGSKDPVKSLSVQDSLTARNSLMPRLRLHHQQEMLFVEEGRPVVLIGREMGNDIVIVDPRASRQHARIERRRDGFVLTDQSTNGCFVALDGQEECSIKDGEHLLAGAGRIGCGFSTQEFEDDIVLFEVI
ncbi:MAG: FHA domain-containing protein [Azoarcus sp.]|jgi:hypothetical protein|nr:FHA domain-containing protein [Azoarcus sp.]